MIPLEFDKKSKEEKNKIIERYYKKLIYGREKNKLKLIQDWYNENLKGFVDDNKKGLYNFEDIVKADYDILLQLKEYIIKGNISQQSLGEKIKDKNKYRYYIKDTLYENMGEAKTYLIKQLDVTTCPYCNRNYINSNEKINTCHLDHFIDKGKYPIFAVSFYNLIPVCPSCNTKKRQVEFKYSPHNIKYKADELMTFSYYISKADYMKKCDSIAINIEINNDNPVLDKSIKTLEIEELYQIHTDVVQELLKKREIFSSGYINSLQSQFPNIIISKKEVGRLVYGNYLEQEDYGKRPLSKLTRDICKQLGII